MNANFYAFSTPVFITFKGTVSRDEYFFEGLNILINTFCVCADGFQGLSMAFKSFSLPYKSVNFLIASLKLLTNLKMLILKPSSKFTSL